MSCRLAKQGGGVLEDEVITTNRYCPVFNQYRGKRLRLEVEHLSPSNDKVKNQ
jgi:hypothetical protein